MTAPFLFFFLNQSFTINGMATPLLKRRCIDHAEGQSVFFFFFTPRQPWLAIVIARNPDSVDFIYGRATCSQPITHGTYCSAVSDNWRCRRIPAPILAHRDAFTLSLTYFYEYHWFIWGTYSYMFMMTLYLNIGALPFLESLTHSLSLNNKHITANSA